ncbi:Spy/CpxP family protein refolding chaperone [uncultured Maribacter sp.]|uniref:Spy/CpxP family protein refolding chaperone n=1 Tax=uncultured Maribacter sp. TaxID=431308 RepID=UPI0026222A70|nr:Spy/CpxP family protein refolding chaperone [uncultured Maribacter sp.]
MKNIKYCSIVVFVFSCFVGFSQDCTLNVGGGNVETIVSVFQLNAVQKSKLEDIKAAYSIEAKSLEEEIEKLLAEHPQSTPQELELLGNKYIALKNKLADKAQETDLKLLESFNEKQYNRYIDLCKEAYRKPFIITPVVYKDSIAPK